MKLIVAIIQPQELTPIKEALIHENIFRFTISNALGQGAEIPIHEV
ncbi:MAG: transcriptional regulator, partial [Candidatus Marinimicrobia bacterium]|nr:transcriptional regulator [Candidatus Neomarinimicrobiota bacterium]